MIIDAVTLHNFGPFKGRHVIDLSPRNQTRHVVLVGGLNGAGKTSLLEGLQLALYGRVAQPVKHSGQSYDEYLLRAINRSAAPSEGAAIGVAFRYTRDSIVHRYDVLRRWAASGTGVRERLEVHFDGSPRPALADTWSEHMESILPSRISPLFFFDGERIEGFADPEASAALLRDAVQSLLGLDIVDKLNADLSTLERRKRETLSAITNDPVAEVGKAEGARLLARRREQTQREGELMNTLDRATRVLEEVNARFRQEGGSVYEMRASLEQRRATVTAQLQLAKTQLRQLAGGVLPIGLIEDQVHAVADAIDMDIETLGAGVRTTEVRRVRELLLTVLAEPLVEDPTRRAMCAILDREVATLEQLAARSVTDANPWMTRGVVSILCAETLPDCRDEARSLLTEHARLESELRTVEQHLLQAPAGDAIADLLHDRDHKIREMRDIERDLHALHEDAAQTDRQIAEHERQLSLALLEVIDERFENEDTARLLRVSERTRTVLAAFRQGVLRKHVLRLQQFVLESYEQLLRKRGLVREILIDPETLQLALVDPHGNQVPAERLSAAERQLLAIAILWGLARASGRALPTVIDTPLGRLDSTHRNRVCGRYFPNASHQVVLLSTDEEIVGDRLKRIKPYLGRTYLLEHDEAAETTTITEGYFAAAGAPA